MTDKTKPPQSPKYPEGSPVKNDRRNKFFGKDDKNSLIWKLLKLFKH